MVLENTIPSPSSRQVNGIARVKARNYNTTNMNYIIYIYILVMLLGYVYTATE